MTNKNDGFTLVPAKKPPQKQKKKKAPKVQVQPRDKNAEAFAQYWANVNEQVNKNKAENERLEKSVTKNRELRLAQVQPVYNKIKQEIANLDAMEILTNISMLLCGKPNNLQEKDLSGGDGRNYLSALPEHIVLNIMQTQALFEDMLLASVSKQFQNIYNKHRKSHNDQVAGYIFAEDFSKPRKDWTLQFKIQRKLYYSGNYELVKTVAEIAWLRWDFFGSDSSNLERSFLALAIVPKKNYLTSLPYIWPLVFDQHGGYNYLLPRNYANNIVSTQPKNYINELFGENMENPALQELLACIVGELIVQNAYPPIGVTNNVTKYHEKMVANKHPIASLPPRVRAIESGGSPGGISLTSRGSYGFREPRNSTLFTQIFPQPPVFPFKQAIALAFSRVRTKFEVKDKTTLADLKELTACCVDFQGRFTKIYEITNATTPLRPIDILSVLVDAQPACLEEIGKDDYEDYASKYISPFFGYGQLFTEAANGGSYSDDWSGAYARLSAWQSLAAIVGVPYADGIEAIEKEAMKCVFFMFGVKKHVWFQHCGHNVGLAILRSDKKTLVVHAVTDSD